MSQPFLEYEQVETAPNPTVSIIWMHGIGDHGSSFVPLVPEFDLAGCPPIRFIFPHAPERPVTANGGYEMRAWFDIFGGFDSDDREDGEGVQQSREFIEELIAQEKARGIATDKIILAGFSQGCAMALETGLCYPEKLGGVIGLSGYIPQLHTFAERYNAANKEVPVFCAHGTADPVVPIWRGQDSVKALTDLGLNVEWHEYPMQHTLCYPEIRDIGNWLRKVLAS
ncbi:MAG: carboxylesterase [Burkholderiaceae bacterium]|nr:carboxylesterase [Burkholderiaceae bacterium]